MGWYILSQAFAFLLTFVRIIRLPEQDKIIGILILRQQLDILLRQQDKPIRPSRVQKMLLAVIAAKLKDVTNKPANQLSSILLRLFKPETVVVATLLIHRIWNEFRAVIAVLPANSRVREPAKDRIRKTALSRSKKSGYFRPSAKHK